MLRLLLAAGLCGLIGLEREARDQAAGLRTHIILGVGAALFTLVSAYGFGEYRDASGFDPTRIAAQIVSGVGFLGAGAILRYGNDVRGVTTAATLWTVAAIGTAVGAGYLFGALSATVIVLLTLLALRALRRTIIPRLRTGFAVMEISFNDGGDDAPRVLETLDRHGIRVRNVDVEMEGQQARYSIGLRNPPSTQHPGHAGRDLQPPRRRTPDPQRSALPGVAPEATQDHHGRLIDHGNTRRPKDVNRPPVISETIRRRQMLPSFF